MHLKAKDDRGKMKREIDNLKLQDTETKEASKLLPTIKVHDIENTTKEDLEESIALITGNKRALTSINTKVEYKFKRAFIRLNKEDYYKLIKESPNRISYPSGMRNTYQFEFVNYVII